MSSFKSLITNLTKPAYFKVILKKVITRLTESDKHRDQYMKWYAEKSHRLEDYAARFDTTLYQEAVAFDEMLNKKAVSVLSTLPVKLGGGGFCALLYYIIRKVRPAIVLETGVAAGFSSHAILSALKKNDSGKLFSSDFPYFRIENPEKYIGILVDADLKDDWKLFTEGDEVNLKKIIGLLGDTKIDLLHYDSDKSYAGREMALKILAGHMLPATLIVFDDINDNDHFYDLVKNKDEAGFRIFSYKKKYIGMISGDHQALERVVPRL